MVLGSCFGCVILLATRQTSTNGPMSHCVRLMNGRLIDCRLVVVPYWERFAGAAERKVGDDGSVFM